MMKKKERKENGQNSGYWKGGNILILLRHLETNEPSDFKNYLRMENHLFHQLLNLVRPHIEKQNTVMRESISAEERLVATLRFLATGQSYEDLKFSSAISAQASGKIIPETCWAIYKVLRNEYLQVSQHLILNFYVNIHQYVNKKI